MECPCGCSEWCGFGQTSGWTLNGVESSAEETDSVFHKEIKVKPRGNSSVRVQRVGYTIIHQISSLRQKKEGSDKVLTSDPDIRYILGWNTVQLVIYSIGLLWADEVVALWGNFLAFLCASSTLPDSLWILPPQQNCFFVQFSLILLFINFQLPIIYCNLPIIIIIIIVRITK